MARLSLLPVALRLLCLSLVAASHSSDSATDETVPLPLLIWHGLGDDYGRDGLQEVAQLADSVNPRTYVHIIRLGQSPADDRQATFLGNVTEQVEQVCQQIQADPILSTAPAVNGLGFSQGGQFLRAYVERCNNPPIHNLVTFGSQHNGIAKFQDCATGDWGCRGAEALLRFGRWSAWVQSHFVPAQYYRNPDELDEYLENSNFLADINNEREIKNEGYKRNLMMLNKFIMYLFVNDITVVPKESAHFAGLNSTTGELIPLRERKIYKEDWIGLKALDEQGKLEFLYVPAAHMQIDDDVFVDTFKKYFGPVDVSSLTAGKNPSHAGLVLQGP